MNLLNLGCGGHYHEDWVNVDLYDSDHVMQHDVYKPLPFEDETFDAVYSAHLLEHLYRFYVPILLGECKRVLKTGGVIRLVVPDLESAAKNYLDALSGADQAYWREMQIYEWAVIELIDQLCRQRSGGEMLEYWKGIHESCAERFVSERCGQEAYHTIESLRKGHHKPLESPREPLAIELSPEAVGEFRTGGQVHLWMYDRYSLRRLMEKAGFKEVWQMSAYESSIPDFRNYHLDVMPDGKERKPDSIYFEGVK
jgi:SAM-dependent methyltransferase